jgi:hypothetical protein
MGSYYREKFGVEGKVDNKRRELLSEKVCKEGKIFDNKQGLIDLSLYC